MHPTFVALLVLAVLLYLLVSLIQPLPPFRKRWHVLFIGFPSAMFAGLIIIVVTIETITERASDSAQTAGKAPEAAEQAPANVATPEERATKELHNDLAATSEPDKDGLGGSGFTVAALTHHNKGLGKRVTYRDPRTARLKRSEVPGDTWTIKADHAEVICFADGNNAVFLAMDGDIVAANGKARQFVDHADGDGILLEDGTLQPVLEPDPARHAGLLGKAIDVGLKLCGQKELGEVSQAVRSAAEQTDAARDEKAIYNDAAVAMVGAKICGYQLDATALADHLRKSGIEQRAFRANIGPYLSLAEGVLKAGDKSFCQDKLLPKFGRDGFGFISN